MSRRTTRPGLRLRARHAPVRKPWLGALAALIASGVLFSAPDAHAQRRYTQTNIDNFKDRLTRLENRYLKPQMITAKFSVETRLNDALVAYNLKQYSQASILFLDVVTKTDKNTYPGYADALYLLGDSLYKMRNFVGARSYLRQVVALGPNTSRYQSALKTLLEIAYSTNNYKDINAIYSRLDAQTALPPSLNYLRGKTLYGQARYAEARTYFDKATADPRLKFTAMYFAGVTLVNEARPKKGEKKVGAVTPAAAPAAPDAAAGAKKDAGKDAKKPKRASNADPEKLKQARARFEAIVKLKAQTPKDQRIINMAYLSLGRLAYERGDYENAIDLYNRLPREDQHFSKAIYEATWALVQLKRYTMAQRNIKVLPLSDPDPDMYTRAMLLQADLSLRIQDYDMALKSFEDILTRYDAVRLKINQFQTAHPDLRAFFNSLVQEDLRLQIPEGLPTIRTDMAVRTPAQWLTEGKVMKKAKTLIGDIGSVRKDVTESLASLDALEARLSSATNIQSFPKLAAGKRLALGISNDVITMRDDLMRREAQLASAALAPAQKTQLKTLAAELKGLRAQYAKTASTPEALQKRDAQIASDFRRMRRKLDEVGLMVDQRRTSLKAVNKYLETQDVKLSQKDRAAFMRLREEITRDLVVWEKLRAELRKRVDVLRQQVGLGDARMQREAQIRDQYHQKLAEMEQLLATSSTPATGELAKLRGLRAQLPAVQARIKAYNDRTDQLVNQQSGNLRGRLKNERIILTTYAQTLDELSGSSKNVVGEIAFRNFLQKKNKFDRIILRADVGKIDVLFQRKEDATREINKLFQSRARELKRLEETFREVR